MHVYHAQTVVKKADVQSFAVLGDGYARDDRHIFWREQSLSCRFPSRTKVCGAASRGRKNPGAFTLLPDGYAKDDRHVYHAQTVVKSKPAAGP